MLLMPSCPIQSRLTLITKTGTDPLEYDWPTKRDIMSLRADICKSKTKKQLPLYPCRIGNAQLALALYISVLKKP